MHFCTDELFALTSMIPFIGYYINAVRAWVAKQRHRNCGRCK